MGHVVAQANEGTSLESLQNQLEAKAREQGADGIVIHGLDRVMTGETTTSTIVEEKRQIKALFIKYEQNL